MATRNGAAHLAEQLASFTAQTHADWSLRVSDDGSTDATRALVAGFRQPDGRAPELADGPRAGSAAANFLALLCAPPRVPGAWIALADQDDVWFPDRLAAGLAALEGVPADRPALFCSATTLTGPDLRPIGPSRRHRRFCFANALVQNVVAGNTVLMTPAAHALVRAAGPVAVPHHDWWLYLLMTGAGGTIRYGAAPTLHYRQHGGNELGENRSAAARRRRAGLLRDGTWAGWVNANIAALRGVEGLLQPEAAARLAAAGPLPPRSAPLARARWLTTARPRRQTLAQTAALCAAILAGRA